MTTDRGSGLNTNPAIRSDLHKKCIDILSKQFCLQDKTTIKTDCDALSVLISTKELTEMRKKSLIEFFHMFGAEAARCGFPHSVIGSKKRKSGIFSCKGNPCQHLPDFIQGREILVIDTPVKVAVDRSCQPKIIEYLQKEGFYFFAAADQGLCFDPKNASNKPPFPILVDAIIASCYVEHLQLHYIHIADMGMRLPIQVTVEKCILNHLFQGIGGMRSKGMTVEIVQLDIAFNIPAGENQLIQLSSKKNSNHHKDSVLSHHEMTIFPIHDLFLNKVQNTLPSKQQEGTVLLLAKDWNTLKSSDMINLSELESMEEIYSATAEEVLQSYTNYDKESEEQCVPQLVLCQNIFYSVKAYSSIAHPILQGRNKLPFQQLQMYHIGRSNMIQLQRLMKHIDYISKEAFKTVKEHGINSRIEVSLRPLLMDKDMRESGHYNDFFAHVAIATQDFVKGQYELVIKYIHPNSTQSQVQRMLCELKPFVMVRASSQFNTVYSNDRITDWLKAQLSMILISTGVATTYGTKFIITWLKDKDRFDPHNLLATLGGYGQCVTTNDEQMKNKILVTRVQKKLNQVLKNCFTDQGRGILVQFVTNTESHTENIRGYYENLSHRDKLCLVSTLLTEIIPQLSQFMAKQEKKKMIIVGTDSGQMDDIQIEEIPGHESWDIYESFINIGTEGNIQDNIYTSFHKHTPSDPVCSMIMSLLQLGKFSDHHNPMFNRKLCKFVLACHSKNIHLPDQNQPLAQLHQTSAANTLLNKCVSDGNFHLNNHQLQMICTELCVLVSGTNQKNETYVKSLCLHYNFPCLGVSHGYQRIKRNEKKVNGIINNILCWDIIHILPFYRPSKKRIMRNTDFIQITIVTKESIIINTFSDIQSHRRFTCHIGCNGYQVLCTCFNVNKSEPSKLRKLLSEFLGRKKFLSENFLTDNGTINPSFEGADSLHQLEKKNSFLLIPTGQISTIVEQICFPPQVLLPIASLVYQSNIMYYDEMNNTAQLHVHHESKVVTYSFDNSRVQPKIRCLTISRTTSNGIEQYFQHELPSHGSRLVPRYQDISNTPVSCAMFGGPMDSYTNLNKIPGLPTLAQVGKKESIVGIIHKVMCELKHEHCEMSTNLLGLTDFCQELALSQVRKHIEFFQESVTNNCTLLSLPMKSIHTFLTNKTMNRNWEHNMICPLFCLKYKLSLAVFETIDRVRSTYFYGFDYLSGKVTCSKVKDYCVLLYHDYIIYLFCSKSKSGYYVPSNGHPVRQKCVYSSLHTKYSHISHATLAKIGELFVSKMKMIILKEGNITDHAELCHSTTVLVPTYLIGSLQNGYGNIIQAAMTANIKTQSLILVFPKVHEPDNWDICIVHHPLNEYDAKMKLFNFLDGLCSKYPDSRTQHEKFNEHNHHSVPADDCEYGFYMALYMMLGHHVKSYSEFKSSAQKLHTESDLCKKTKEWVKVILNETLSVSEQPTWLHQIIT